MTIVQRVWIGLGVRAWKERHQNEAIHCCMTGHFSINAAIFIHLIVDRDQMEELKTVWFLTVFYLT